MVEELPASEQNQYDITIESKVLESEWLNYEESMNKIIQNDQADETIIEEEIARLNDDQEELDDIKYHIELKKAFNAKRERETAAKLGAIPKNSKANSSYTSLGATEKYGANKQKEEVDEDRSKHTGAVAADKQLKIDIPTDSWNTDNLLEPPLFSSLRQPNN